MAYKCRAYPDTGQRQLLARTFGCVRVVWNRTLADRHTRYATESKSTSYAQTDADTAAPPALVMGFGNVGERAIEPSIAVVADLLS